MRDLRLVQVDSCEGDACRDRACQCFSLAEHFPATRFAGEFGRSKKVQAYQSCIRLACCTSFKLHTPCYCTDASDCSLITSCPRPPPEEQPPGAQPLGLHLKLITCRCRHHIDLPGNMSLNVKLGMLVPLWPLPFGLRGLNSSLFIPNS